MICPNMATMLSVVLCDAKVEAPLWQKLLREACLLYTSNPPKRRGLPHRPTMLTLWRKQPVTGGDTMWETIFLILAIIAVLVILRLAKKWGLNIMPCG